MISASSAKRSRASPASRFSQGVSPGSTSSPTLTDTVSLHLLPRVDHKNGARRTSSPGGRCLKGRNEFRPGVSLPSSGERNFVKADLLPGDDEYGRSSPPPEDRPAKRHPPDLLPRRVLLFSESKQSGSRFGGGHPCRQFSAPLSSTPRFFHWLSGKMSGAPPIGAYQESTTHLVPPRSLITAVQWG